MTAPASPEPSASTPVTGTKTPARPAEPDERLLDSPGRPTLVILGSICLATLIMWAAGRAACNYHVPGESLTPRAVSLEERTANPKDLAIEFAQALGRGDFASARSLASGEALAFVEQEQVACPGGCAARRARAEKLATLSELLAFNPVDGYVRTRSLVAGVVVAEQLLEVERGEKAWKVTRVLDAKLAVPALKQGTFPGSPAPQLGPLRP